MNEEKTIVVKGETIPATTVVNGRKATRIPPKESVDIYSLFHGEFKGPFRAEDDAGNSLPPLIGSEYVGQDNSASSEEPTKLTVLFDDHKRAGGRVVDANDKLVVTTPSWKIAKMVTIALNKQPYSMTDGSRTGLSPFHGIRKHESGNDFAFWCIRVPILDADKFNDEGALVLRLSYLGPFYYRHGEMLTVNNPMQALRFSSRNGAAKFLEDMRNTLLADPTLTAITEDRYAKYLAKAKLRENFVALGRPKWSLAEPVRVVFAYTVQ